MAGLPVLPAGSVLVSPGPPTAHSGNVIAWENYSAFIGIRDSPWHGWQNLQDIFIDPDVETALRNTLIIEFLRLIVAFPVPLALALLVNSLLSERVKRSIQSVVYLPHVLSWVIVIAIWQQMVGGDGLLNQILVNRGYDRVSIVGNPVAFYPLVILRSI